MNRVSFSKSLGVALAAFLGAAFTTVPSSTVPGLAYNPQHYVNNDPIWDAFNQAIVTPDLKKGAYHATFSADLEARQDKMLKVTGFILPLEASTRSAHFILVRRNTGCPFCPPNAPTEAVEVYAQAPVTYTGQEMAAVGRFRLVASSADGLFYRLDLASVTPTGH